MKVRFKKYNCVVKFRKYPNKRIAIQLEDARTGESIIMASTNIPEVSLEEGEVIIKDFSENEGVLQALLDAGVIERTGRRVEGGYITCEICRLK